MSLPAFKTLRNCQAMAIDNVPLVSATAFRKAIIDAVKNGSRICAFFGVPQDRLSSQGLSNQLSQAIIRLFAVLSLDFERRHTHFAGRNFRPTLRRFPSQLRLGGSGCRKSGCRGCG